MMTIAPMRFTNVAVTAAPKNPPKFSATSFNHTSNATAQTAPQFSGNIPRWMIGVLIIGGLSTPFYTKAVLSSGAAESQSVEILSNVKRVGETITSHQLEDIILEKTSPELPFSGWSKWRKSKLTKELVKATNLSEQEIQAVFEQIKQITSN